MGFAAKLENGFASATGTLASKAVGSLTGGSTLSLHDVTPGTLSALYTVDAETDTVTIAAAWEVSTDGSTWVRLMNATNTAPTVLATGTAGSDASVSRAVAAPREVYGWPYCRASVLVGGTTAQSADTYTISYAFQRKTVDA